MHAHKVTWITNDPNPLTTKDQFATLRSRSTLELPTLQHLMVSLDNGFVLQQVLSTNFCRSHLPQPRKGEFTAGYGVHPGQIDEIGVDVQYFPPGRP